MGTEGLGAWARSAQAGWDWWLRELAGLFPWFAAWFSAGAQGALIASSGTETSLTVRAGRRSIEQSWPVELESLTAEHAESIRKACGSHPLELAMPPATVHRLTVQLPSAAGGRHEAVRYALLSGSPVSLDAIVFDWRELGPSRREGWMDVEVWLCRKAVLDRLIGHLAKFGLAVARVGVVLPEAPGRLAFTLHRAGNARGWTQARLRAFLLGGVAFCLLGSVLATGAAATWNERGLQRAIQALAAKHRQVEPLARRQSRLQAIDDGLSRSSLPPLSSVLDELARVTPKEVWLTQLQYQSGQVKVTGRSSDTGAVLPALRNSRMFKDVRMDVVNAIGAGSDGVATFELSLTVVPFR